MSHFKSRWIRVLGVALMTTLIGLGAVYANDIVGPSTTQTPYYLPAAPHLQVTSILTVGDAVNGYRLVGIPDGLGAFDNGDGTFTLLMNHELSSSQGITRTHGAKGAFISKWIIRKSDLKVLHGEDLIQNVALWNRYTGQYDPPTQGVTMGRFCSADLPPLSAFYHARSGRGYSGRIFMNGEEVSPEGRAFAHLLNGTSYELPWLGKFSWENAVPNPYTGVKTVVVGLDDSSGGQVYIYVGEKTTSNHLIEAAGLSNGVLLGVQVFGVPVETDATVLNGPTPFSTYNFGDVSYLTGAELESLSTAHAVTAFQRPEDGAWDPRFSHRNDFYFVTTAGFNNRSRLWRLRFYDAAQPELGGTIEMLLEGTEGQKMMDNITVTRTGWVYIQEDPGNQAYLAKIWRYNIATDTLSLVAEADPSRFSPGGPNFLTQDEESSGIIDMSSILGRGWFLFDVQVHYAIGDPELVEGGQLLALYQPPRSMEMEERGAVEGW